MDKFTWCISFCFASVAPVVSPPPVHSFRHSPCLHPCAYCHFGKLIWGFLIIFAGKLALITASKNQLLAVPGLDIAFVFCPWFCLSFNELLEWKRNGVEATESLSRSWCTGSLSQGRCCNSPLKQLSVMTVKRQKFLTGKVSCGEVLSWARKPSLWPWTR